MATFWWSSGENRRKIHWLSWKKLCLPKSLGGLGFRDLESFNQALLAKQAWRLLQYPQSLFSQVFKSKYFSHTDFLSSQLGSHPSYAWRSVLFGRELLLKGLAPVIGNGLSKKVWVDSWLWDGIRWRPPLIKHCLVNFDQSVANLIDYNRRDWNRQLLQDLFYPDDVARITASKPLVNRDDFWIWHPTRSGSFTVKSAYKLASQSSNNVEFQEANQLPSINPLKARVWNVKTAPKIKSFLWRALSDSLPVSARLLSRGMSCDPRCQACGNDLETANHLLFTCPQSRLIWALSGFPCPNGGFHESSLFQNFSYLLNSNNFPSYPHDITRLYPWILWIIWKNRNKLVFEGQTFDPLLTIKKIHGDTNQWFDAQQINTSFDIRINGAARREQCIHLSSWSPPHLGWLKCNIGFSWSSHSRKGGAAWVVRNSEGIVLLHSRRAFSNLNTLLDAQLQSLLWSIDCMKHHKFQKIVFAINAKLLTDFTLDPAAWPRFTRHSSSIFAALRLIPDWSLQYASTAGNRGAVLIAKSVIRDSRFQSYVASGPPSWLKSFFAAEQPFVPTSS